MSTTDEDVELVDLEVDSFGGSDTGNKVSKMKRRFSGPLLVHKMIFSTASFISY